MALAGLLTSFKPRRVRRRVRRKLWRRRRPNIHRRSRPQLTRPSGLQGYGDVPEDRQPDTDGPIPRELSSHGNVQEEESSSNIDATITSTGDDCTQHVTPNCSLGENARDSIAEPRDLPPTHNTPNTSCGSLSQPSVKGAPISCHTQDSGFSDCGCSVVSTSDDCCNGTDNCNGSSNNCSGTGDDLDKHGDKGVEDSHHRLESTGVTLEGVELTQDGSGVIGTILVCNECYEKHVAVRHTSNDWKTFQDTSAQWMETVEGGAVDRFQFYLEIPDGEFSMEFAISFNEKWDNNEGKNYSISCTVFNA